MKPTSESLSPSETWNRRVANLYLDPPDQLMAAKGWEMTRYADDFIIQCHTEAEAHAALARESHEVKGASLTCGHSSTGEPDARNSPVRF